MDQKTPITVETIVKANMKKVWDYWTHPEHIEKWTFASDDWEAYDAKNDVRVGGKFSTTMAAKDKSARFDFNGVYTGVEDLAKIEYDMEDGRHVSVDFLPEADGVRVVETFDPENMNSPELQKAGWQSIMDNFKKYVEAN